MHRHVNNNSFYMALFFFFFDYILNIGPDRFDSIFRLEKRIIEYRSQFEWLTENFDLLSARLDRTRLELYLYKTSSP